MNNINVMWTYLTSFLFPYEAQIAKARLNAEGIDAVIENEHTINMNWLYSNAIGGVKLKVLQEQLEQARTILSEDYSEDLEEQFGNNKLKCPHCLRQNVESYVQGKRMAFLTMTILNFPLSKIKQGYICKDCDKFFE